MTFHSQCGEDKWILENLKPPVGTYCEVGAYDGVMSSNTKVFEDLGWQGILVEPDPLMAAQCWENRSLQGNAQTWCCAVGKGDEGIFYVNELDRGLSGFDVPIGKAMNVLVKRLDWIIRTSGFDSIDLISIDTEGTELEVWETIGNVRPKIVIIEHQTLDRPSKKPEILERFQRDGYKCVHETQYNLIFVNAKAQAQPTAATPGSKGDNQ